MTDSINHPLDEFVERYSSVQKLKENLKTNLQVMTNLNPTEIDTLLRFHMIMVRQCLLDFGAEE